MKRRLLALFLALSMVCALLPAAVSAAEPDTGWYNGQDSSFTLDSAAELMGLAQLVAGGNDFAGKTILLGADVDLQNEAWTPIGDLASSAAFAGTFDGQSKTVKNLFIEDETLSGAGLFGYIAKTGTIQNLTLENASVKAESYAGALVGSAFTGTVTNCTVKGDISIEGHYMIGGLAGSGYADLIDCSVIGNSGSTVTGIYKEADLEGDNIGGLIGFRGEGAGISTVGCSVENLSVSGTRKVGGLIGSAFNDNEITDCSVSSAQVTSTATADYAAQNASSMGLGGIVGTYTDNNGGEGGVLEDCYVDNITLACSSDIAEYAKMGYVTGTLRGDIAPPATVDNLCTTGTNTGATVSDEEGTTIFNGSSPVAEVNGTPFASLPKAFTAAKDKQTIKLLDDITNCANIPLTDGREITVDFNGHSVGFLESCRFQIQHGTLHLTGTGTAYEELPSYSPVVMFGSAEDVADYSVVTVGEDITLKGWAGLFISYATNEQNQPLSYGIRADVYGTLVSMKDSSDWSGHSLYINGQNTVSTGNVPKILLDGATLRAESTGPVTTPTGMYLAGYAETTVRNSTIDCSVDRGTAIEIRAGKLDIIDSTLIGGSGEVVSDPNGSGSTTVNAAISIAQHTTKLPIEVTISGNSSLKGGAALYESNPQKNPQESIDDVQVAVQGGSFEGTVYSEDKTGFISGGTFTDTAISDNNYLAPGMDLVPNEDGKFEVELDDSFFTGGTGTEADPYIIASVDGLKGFRDSVNKGVTYAGMYIQLAEGTYDLSAEEWTAIGNGARDGSGYTGASFNGVFDGNGQTITNLTITESNPANANVDSAAGLFGIVANGGVVKNLTLSNVAINLPANELTGAVAGMLQDATLDGCTISGTVAMADGGGVAGRIVLEGEIKNCINHATVHTSTGVAGGIVSKAYYTADGKDMRITNCVNDGPITSDSYHAAGIAGFSAADISGCTNSGVITAGNSAGGIVGEQTNYGTISDNENTAAINGGSNAGGIVGWVRYQNSASYAKSAIITVKNNTNAGNILCTSAGGSTLGFGGIAGTIYNAGIVTGNTNTASSVTGGTFAAGVVGNLQSEKSNLFYDAQEITVKNNVSQTAIENISGNCTDQYAYNNNSAGDVFAVVQNGTDWVAQIGETKYACLEGAVAAAGELSGDVTVSLLGDVNIAYMLEENGTVSSSYSKYFDLSGSELTSLTITSSTDGAGITSGIDGNGIDGPVYCPVLNIKLPAGASLVVDGLTFANDLLFDSNGGSVTMQNCTFNGSQSGYPTAASVSFIDNVFDFKGNPDGFYSHNAYAVWYKVDGTLDFVFDGNTVTGYRGVHVETRSGQADINVDNNTFTLNQEAAYEGDGQNHNTDLQKHLQKEVALQLVGHINGAVSFQGNTVDAYMAVCLYNGIALGSDSNTSLTVLDNTLVDDTKLYGSNEWSFATTEDADAAANAFIESMGDDATITAGPSAMGPFVVTGGAGGTDYSYSEAEKELTINTTTPVTVSMKQEGAATDSTIRILTDKGTADITLDNVNIHTTEKWQAILITKSQEADTYAPCTLRLKGTSTLRGEYQYGHALRYYNESLTITSEDGGVLNVSNTGSNAAIHAENGTNLTVQGNAVVKATSEQHNAINNCGLITIKENAQVTAAAGKEQTAIMSGNNTGEHKDTNGIVIGDNAKVTITKGKYGLYPYGLANMVIDGNAEVDISGLENYAIYNSASGISIGGNAVIRIHDTNGGGIWCKKDNIILKEQAQINIATNGAYGIFAQSNVGLTIQDEAKVNVQGATTNGIYCTLPVLISNQADVEIVSAAAFGRQGFTVSPAAGKLYKVASGDDAVSAAIAYYSSETAGLAAQTKYFHAQISNVVEWGTDGEAYGNSGTFADLRTAIGSSAEPVYARLLGDAQLDTSLSVPSGKTLVFDLAGYTLTASQTNDTFLYINDSATLQLEDSSAAKTGTVTGHQSDGSRSAVQVMGGGTFIMNGGTITKNHGGTSPGGVKLMRNAKFIMNGGSITGNTSDNPQAGVDAANGSFVEVSGTAVITGNTGMDGDCDLWIDTLNGNTLTIGENGLDETAKIGIYINSRNFTFGQAFTAPYASGKAAASNFINNSGNFEVKEIDTADGQKQMILSRLQTITLAASPAETSVYGADVTLTATLEGASSPNGNTIQFYNNAGETPVLLGTADTAGGVATLTLNAPEVADYTFEAVFAGTESYEIVRSNEVAYAVTSATATLVTAPKASRIQVGEQLSASTLSGGVVTGLDGTELAGTWSWKNDREMAEDGFYKETAVFTPADSNYAPVEAANITVTVYRPSSGGGETVATRYTVTFDTQGGSEIGSVRVIKNGVVPKPAAPTRAGYTFEGWFTDAACKTAYDFDTKVTSDITLYAKWSIEPTIPEEPVDPDDWKNPYSDVSEQAWFYDAVKYATENGLFSGVSETEFAPDGTLSRGMLVTVLWRAEEKPVVNYLMMFDDVDQAAYYGEAVRWAASEGIVKGYSDTEFAPDQTITREEIAAILERYANYKSIDTSARGDLTKFADEAQISDWAKENVSWAVGYGLLSGKENSQLDPQGNATRAEMAAMLQRFFENLK